MEDSRNNITKRKEVHRTYMKESTTTAFVLVIGADLHWYCSCELMEEVMM